MIKTWHKISVLALGALPNFAFAQNKLTDKTVGGILQFLTNLISSTVIPLLFAVAIVVFIWGVIQYITAAGDTEKRNEGLQYIIWGLVGIFVMTAVWGLVSILTETFGVKFGIPQFKTSD
jgi:hypothetical protein